jgi:AraC-like DNA-binding protein
MAGELPLSLLECAQSTGLWPTLIPALQIVRSDAIQRQLYALHRPSVCFVLQGRKEVCVGSVVFRYGANEFLFSSVDLPVTGAVIEATPRKPYICLVLAIDPSLVFELASVAPGGAIGSAARARRAIFVGQRDDQVTDAFLRLLRCLATPTDARVLAPGVIREITYRLLLGPYGDAVRDLGIADGHTQRIARVIERIKRDYAKDLPTAELARLAGMSVSSFHQHFKKITTLSPLQFQKRLRLQEARRLLLARAASAADISFSVGYDSPSQFSREYARLFGAAPVTDIKRALSNSAH